MQTPLGNNRTKVRNKISSEFWEIAVFIRTCIRVFYSVNVI